MRFVRCGEPGAEVPALDDGSGVFRDASSIVHDWAGETLDPRFMRGLRGFDIGGLPKLPLDIRLGCPVGGVGKLVCVGLNYRDHAAEAGMKIPDEPVLFHKSTGSICGPHDDLQLPPGSMKTDWEVELGIVIGRTAKRVSAAEARDRIAGYVMVNDFSEREHQLEKGGQWTKGKSHDSFGPIGPWLLTADEVNPGIDWALWLEVNGVRYQDGSSRNMIFGVHELVSYISNYMTLSPGDIISTGTPAGVGLGCKPPRFLHHDDIVACGISGLGTQRHRVVDGVI